MVLRVKLVLSLLTAAALVGGASPPVEQPVAVRAPGPFTMRDFLTTKKLGQVVPSPDGKSVAAVVKRGPSESSRYGASFVDGNERADIWIADGAGPARDVTHGAKDGTGHYNPVWSPDGRMLAFASTRGGDDVFLHVWDRESGEIRKLTPRGVQTMTNASGYLIQWLDSRRVIAPMVNPGRRSLEYGQWLEAQRAAPKEWAKVERGKENTASVLDSSTAGRADTLDEEIAVIDAVTGKITSAGPARTYTAGNLVADPTGRRIARVDDLGPTPARAGQLKRVLERRTRLAIASAAGGQPRVVTEVPSPSVTVQPRWAADGANLLVVGKATPKTPDPFTAYLVPAAGGKAAPLAADRLVATGLLWGAGTPLVRGTQVADAADPAARQDWWAFDPADPAAKPRDLTSRFKVPPLELVPVAGGVLGVADGRAWLIDPRTGQARDLKATGAAPLAELAWPLDDGVRRNGVRPTDRGGAEPANPRLDRDFPLVLARDTKGGLYELAPGAAPVLTPLPAPHPEAGVAGYSPANRTAVFGAGGDQGTALWTTHAGRHTQRISLNGHLAQVLPPQRRLVTYKGADGEKLTGALLLPPGHRDGQRHPLVVNVYGTRIVSTLEDVPEFQVNNPSYLTLQFLAAGGYAVLVPSIPRPEGKAAAEPMTWPTKPIMNAVDAAIDSGVADSKRLAVMGHSFGSYNVHSLVTRTDRFEAAIAISGFSDVISSYGVFDSRFRYTPRAQEWFAPAYIEDPAFEFGLGRPPWEDPQRYVRNSPLLHAGKIKTPVLMLHGERDYLTHTGSEEMYTALARQAKKVRLVSYWGEAHMPYSMVSPANFQSMIEQELDWLRLNLPGSER
ncbi:prolyl oligopeptidase family serine peptidase [Streptosporangium sp. NPDC006013]|uniref:S9 family peptidase n=1 Tax=Streptosporangium sp. NPDC006013 TaxID=3155596 RepID=UPI0033B783D0